MTTTVLRVCALLLAAGGLLQPSFTVHRPASLPVAVQSASRVEAAGSPDLLADVSRRLAESLGSSVVINGPSIPRAVVLVGGTPDSADLPNDASLDVPTSVVSVSGRAGASIVSVRPPLHVLPGWEAAIEVELQANGMRGRTSTISLEQHGIALATAEQGWTRDREQTVVRLTYVPPEPGTWPMRIRLETPGVGAEAADIRLSSAPRPLAVAFYDSRPNWSTTFVRRVLEADQAFAVSGLVRASRGLDVRSGALPALTSEALAPFDAVIVGAPDDLARREVDAIREFVRRRGGAVIFLPDRKPSGPYLDLLPPPGFDEVLLEKPAEIATGRRPMRGSEFAVLRSVPVATEVLASLTQGRVARPVVASWTAGGGRIIFSGVLDAWRYRERDDEAFGTFWRSVIARAALASPRRLSVDLDPGIAPPGAPVTVRVRLRPTELTRQDGVTAAPAMSGQVVDASSGASTFLRLWPTGEAGAFEGRFIPPSAGRYDVRVTVGGGATGDAPLIVSSDAQPPRRSAPDAAALLAALTGGVVAAPDDLTTLENHLRDLPRPVAARLVRPSQLPWWMGTFVALACAEWAVRRQRGQR